MSIFKCYYIFSKHTKKRITDSVCVRGGLRTGTHIRMILLLSVAHCSATITLMLSNIKQRRQLLFP